MHDLYWQAFQSISCGCGQLFEALSYTLVVSSIQEAEAAANKADVSGVNIPWSARPH